MVSAEQHTHLPQKDSNLFKVNPKLLGLENTIKQHFGETSFIMFYGSAAFKQIGYSKEEINASLLDCIIAVPDIEKWHKQHQQDHLQDFPSHAQLLGAATRSQLQGPNAWYIITELPVTMDGQVKRVKCGVINQHDLIADLEDWNQFYIAGRMQKPTYIPKSTPEIDKALYHHNMKQGLRMVLLTLANHSEQVSLQDLYMQITSLSYTGDTRMAFAENRNKMANIVNDNLWRFDLMYQELIKEAAKDGLLLIQGDNIFPVTWKDDRNLFIQTVEQLPANIVTSLPPNWQNLPINEITTELTKVLGNIVKESSIRQTLLGLLTVSPQTGIEYVARKLKKAKKN